MANLRKFQMKLRKGEIKKERLIQTMLSYILLMALYLYEMLFSVNGWWSWGVIRKQGLTLSWIQWSTNLDIFLLSFGFFKAVQCFEDFSPVGTSQAVDLVNIKLRYRKAVRGGKFTPT